MNTDGLAGQFMAPQNVEEATWHLRASSGGHSVANHLPLQKPPKPTEGAALFQLARRLRRSSVWLELSSETEFENDGMEAGTGPNINDYLVYY